MILSIEAFCFSAERCGRVLEKLSGDACGRQRSKVTAQGNDKSGTAPARGVTATWPLALVNEINKCALKSQ